MIIWTLTPFLNSKDGEVRWIPSMKVWIPAVERKVSWCEAVSGHNWFVGSMVFRCSLRWGTRSACHITHSLRPLIRYSVRLQLPYSSFSG